MSLGWLTPLEYLYGAATGLKNAAYDRRWARVRRLDWPVISVGNLSVGGAGKTPVVILLAELLRARGVAVSVLSRGYGRRSAAVEVVDPGGTAERFGDEPLLIARRLQKFVHESTDRRSEDGGPEDGARRDSGLEAGRPGWGRASVAVGADRFRAGLLAQSLWPAGVRGVHLLDDGFQHRRLARDLDVVVVHRSDLEPRLLPVGRLREPLRALRRAGVLVLRDGDRDLEAALRARGLDAPIWWVRRSLELAPSKVPAGEVLAGELPARELPPGEQSELPVSEVTPDQVTPDRFVSDQFAPADIAAGEVGPGGRQLTRRVVAFCGIARPAEFFAAVREAGGQVVSTRAFRDHHRYSPPDMSRLFRVAIEARAEAFVTTEKDAVRLGPALLKILTGSGQTGIQVARLNAVFLDEDRVVNELLALPGLETAAAAGSAP
ncbi:MAG TPA: tetraacyldisaccharide 4'-kinase [Acidisarcina sp.]